MRLPILVSAFLFASAQPAGAASSGCAVLAEGRSRHEFNLFYGAKVLAIMRAAQANDRDVLRREVDPAFSYTLTDGDHIMGPRLAVGSDAAIMLVRIIKPKSYRIETISDGPIMISTDSCRWTVRVVFNDPQTWDGYGVLFAFSEDRLVSAKGDSLRVTNGEFPEPAN